MLVLIFGLFASIGFMAIVDEIEDEESKVLVIMLTIVSIAAVCIIKALIKASAKKSQRLLDHEKEMARIQNSKK